MAVSEWHGGKIVTIWGLGLLASQLLFVYALRPGGALMSVVAHLVIPVALISVTGSWCRTMTGGRLARLTGGQVGMLWGAWVVGVAVLHLGLVVWRLTAADPFLAEAASVPLRRLGWFGLVPAFLFLVWLTWQWFGAHEDRGD